MPGDLTQAQQVGTWPDPGNKGTTFTERGGAFSDGGVRLQRNLKKLILPVIFSTRICCHCTVSLLFLFSWR